jgi:hypothetical protein
MTPQERREKQKTIKHFKQEYQVQANEIAKLRAQLRLKNIGATHGKTRKSSSSSSGGGGSGNKRRVGGGGQGAEFDRDERMYFDHLKNKLENRIKNSSSTADYPRVLSPTARPAQSKFGQAPSVATRAFKSMQDTTHVDRAFVGEGGSRELFDVRKELREKKARIALLQSQYEQMAVAFRAEKDIQKHTLAQCEELKDKLLTTQKGMRAAKREVETLRLSGDTMKDQEIIIGDLRAEVVTLQDQAALLTQNMFQGDQIEKRRMKKVITQHVADLQKTEMDLEKKEKRLEALEKKLRDKESMYGDQKGFTENLVQEKMTLEKQLEERMKQLTHALDRLAVFSADSGVDLTDLEQALDLVRRKREDPTRVDILGGGKFNNLSDSDMDKPALLRKINKLEIQNRELVKDYNLAQDMLKNAGGNHKLAKHQFHKVNEELKKAFRDSTTRLKMLEAENTTLRQELEHRPLAENMEDSIFENSDEEFGELDGLENLVALRVIKAELNREFALFKPDEPPMTFLGADFFAFKTSFSTLFGGWTPDYSFTTQVRPCVLCAVRICACVCSCVRMDVSGWVLGDFSRVFSSKNKDKKKWGLCCSFKWILRIQKFRERKFGGQIRACKRA